MPGVSSSWFRYRDKQFTSYFAQEDELVYCNNIKGLMDTLKISYDPAQLRIFIDSSKRSKKLVYNGSFYAYIPVDHLHTIKVSSTLRKPKYKNKEQIAN